MVFWKYAFIVILFITVFFAFRTAKYSVTFRALRLSGYGLGLVAVSSLAEISVSIYYDFTSTGLFDAIGLISMSFQTLGYFMLALSMYKLNKSI